MTKLLGNLEDYIRVSYEVEESHTSVIKIVHQFLGDMNKNIVSIMEDGRVGTINRLVENIVPCPYLVNRADRRRAEPTERGGP